jgi:chemotaxis protein MotA
MKAASLIGIAVGILGLLGGAVLEGTSPAAFISPPAFLIVFGGLFGATLASVGLDAIKRVPKLYKKAFSPEPIDMAGTAAALVAQAEQARREGLLSLEQSLATVQDPFMRTGLQLVVDGTEPELVREVLEGEIDAMEQRHRANAHIFDAAGGFAPTMGIIGTVMGLVHVLENLADPATLGPAISSAFIATLLGVGSANVIFLPVGSRLKALSADEVAQRTMMLEGILSIQAGDNPRLVTEKLATFVPPAARSAEVNADVQPNLRLADADAAATAA